MVILIQVYGKLNMDDKLSFKSVKQYVQFWKQADISRCSILVLNQVSEQIESQVYDQIWTAWEGEYE